MLCGVLYAIRLQLKHMASATITVPMDQQGRIIITKPARDKLDIDWDEVEGNRVPVEVEVRT